MLFVLIVAISPGCKKEMRSNESDLYGAWAKGANHGDTLWFMKKDGKHIMRIAESFNPSLPIYKEKEYSFNRGILSIRTFSPVSQDYFPITSFAWTDPGKEFTILNVQLYLFMSSIVTYKYRKI
jgi:hypothetical protein